LKTLKLKVFFPVAAILLIGIRSGSLAGSGDSSGVHTPVRQPSATHLQVLKSVGLLKPSQLKAVKVTPDDQDEAKPVTPSVPVRFSGYARAFIQYRTMDKYYNDMYGGPNNLTVNGVNYIDNLQNGYPEPFLMLQADANPTAKTSVCVQYYLDNQMTGQMSDSGRQALLYRTFNFKGNIYSNIGTFSLTAGGGVNWARMTPFTLGNNLQYYRQDMFERLPWQYYGSSAARYSSYYEDLNISVDTRWSRAGTQGFILEGSGLPAGFGFMALYGKTDNSGGFRSYVQTSASPIKNVIAGRLYNNHFGHEIGLNFFRQFGYTNAQQLKPEAQNIATIDFKIRPRNLNIYLELGAGSYKSPDYKEKWSPSANLVVQVDRKVIGLPFSVHAYQVGESVVNVNSDVLNSSIPYVQPTYPIQNGTNNLFSSSDITTFPGIMTEVGQMTNNRRGADLQANHSLGNLKISFGYSINQELENKYQFDSRYNVINFNHRLNSFTRSRFGYFLNGIGPYSAITSIYRRTFEKVQITDTDVSYKKAYNAVDLTLKYKLKLFKKELILVNYVTYSTAQDKLSALPVFDDKAFVRYLYEEVNAFYPLHKKLTLVGYFGIETMKANNRTQMVDEKGDIITDPKTGLSAQAPENGKPRDQIGTGYGLGLDYDFSERAGLFFRHRIFHHRDKNFTKDEFQGQESSVELKIFF